MLRRLLQMKALDRARLLGHVVVAIDGTGHLHCARQHCPHCLVRRSPNRAVYLHMVEEAKLVGPGGMALSMGTVFIDTTEVPGRAGEAPDAGLRTGCGAAVGASPQGGIPPDAAPSGAAAGRLTIGGSISGRTASCTGSTPPAPIRNG